MRISVRFQSCAEIGTFCSFGQLAADYVVPLVDDDILKNRVDAVCGKQYAEYQFYGVPGTS